MSPQTCPAAMDQSGGAEALQLIPEHGLEQFLNPVLC